MTSERPPRKLIEPPPDFPVEWHDPADARRLWMQERWHSPDPITPLSFDVNDRVLYEGFRRGAAATGAPLRQAITRINTYLYLTTRRPRPDEPAPTDEVPHSVENLRAWDERWLPEVQEHLRELADMDLAGASDRELAAHIEDTIARAMRCWTIHGMAQFEQRGLVAVCTELLDLDLLTIAAMSQGFPNKSLECDDGIRALASQARANGEVAAVVRSTEAAELHSALRALPAAGGLLDEVDAFLGEFGRKSDNFTELSLPSWVEQPDPLFALLKLYLDDETDTDSVRRGLVEAREQAIAAARTQLQSADAETVEWFERELLLAQRGTALMETHNYWIDQQTMYWLRQVLIEGGRRLAGRGVIEDAEDVMYLWLDDLLALLRSNDVPDRRSTVDERCAEMERWAAVEAPVRLGVDVPLPGGIRLMFGLSDHGGEPEDGIDVTEVTGQPGSPGTLRARARVIGSIADGARLAKGEVLVTATTSPPWTPLFGVAGALVTDAGGALSHCAIVAREYGIPAVVGTGNATTAIPDGALVEVDGVAGVVRIVES
ncbi:MAG: PEP-utilizing enzyme [Dehalococcoidia bacterium]|jgi:pyruvate,water dikinase|nr:PEP-utilizing enzyme [Dehalococcoidia bacterium]